MGREMDHGKIAKHAAVDIIKLPETSGNISEAVPKPKRPLV